MDLCLLGTRVSMNVFVLIFTWLTHCTIDMAYILISLASCYTNNNWKICKKLRLVLQIKPQQKVFHINSQKITESSSNFLPTLDLFKKFLKLFLAPNKTFPEWFHVFSSVLYFKTVSNFGSFKDLSRNFLFRIDWSHP